VPLHHCTVIPLRHCATVPLSRCITIPLCHCATAQPYHCFTVPPYHWAAATLYHCVTVPLRHCAVVPLCHCDTVPLVLQIKIFKTRKEYLNFQRDSKKKTSRPNFWSHYYSGWVANDHGRRKYLSFQINPCLKSINSLSLSDFVMFQITIYPLSNVILNSAELRRLRRCLARRYNVCCCCGAVHLLVGQGGVLPVTHTSIQRTTRDERVSPKCNTARCHDDRLSFSATEWTALSHELPKWRGGNKV
jgi:hypothetical protein